MNDVDRAIVDFAARRYRHAGARETAIRDELGMTATTFYQRLNRLLDDAEVEAYSPVEVHRLRRLRESGQRLKRAG